jgi:hypothetical protein
MARMPNAVSTLREHLRERPFALALSSGFFGFFAHTGLLAGSREPPRRVGLVSLMIRGLPRLGPFRLEAGMQAFERARAGAVAALGRRVEPVVVV